MWGSGQGGSSLWCRAAPVCLPHCRGTTRKGISLCQNAAAPQAKAAAEGRCLCSCCLCSCLPPSKGICRHHTRKRKGSVSLGADLQPSCRCPARPARQPTNLPAAGPTRSTPALWLGRPRLHRPQGSRCLPTAAPPHCRGGKAVGGSNKGSGKVVGGSNKGSEKAVKRQRQRQWKRHLPGVSWQTTSRKDGSKMHGQWTPNSHRSSVANGLSAGDFGGAKPAAPPGKGSVLAAKAVQTHTAKAVC